jgi:undecaprenyl-diphosphatase
MFIPDHAITHLINRTWSTPFFDTVMPVVTNFGEWEILVALALALLFFKNRDVRTLGLLLLVALWAAHIVGPYLKDLVARPRPFLSYPDIKALVEAHGPSFPSGHALYAFTCASLVCAFIKRHYIFYFFAFLVAFSRVYLGVHYPTDVLGGALIGIVIGWTTYSVYYFVDVINDRFRQPASNTN